MPHVLELESHCAVVYSSLLMDGWMYFIATRCSIIGWNESAAVFECTMWYMATKRPMTCSTWKFTQVYDLSHAS